MSQFQICPHFYSKGPSYKKKYFRTNLMKTGLRTPIPLKIERIKRGIKAYDFAKELNISPTKLSFIENGVDEPDWWIKERAAEVLDVPYDCLWSEK